jgi:hypothetical protein
MHRADFRALPDRGRDRPLERDIQRTGRQADPTRMHTELRLLLLATALALPLAADADPNAWAQVAADASVRSDAPDTVLQADLDLASNALHRTFVAFRLPAVGDARIVSATLRIGWNSGAAPRSGRHQVALVASDLWSEATLTWSGQPAAAADPIGVIEVGALAPATETHFDVSAAAITEQLGDRGIAFRIAPAPGSSSAELRFGPRERSPAFVLELVLDPVPRLATGDLVRIDLFPAPAVMASDPELLLRRQLTRLIAPQWLHDLARDPIDGSWVAVDLFDERILRIDPVTGALRVAYQSERLQSTSNLTVGPDGTIWTEFYDYDPVLETSTWSLARIDRETGEATDVASGNLLGEPRALLADAMGSSIYWIGSGVAASESAVVRIDAQTGEQTLAASGGLLDAPVALAFAPGSDSVLWIVDAGNWNAPALLRVDLASGAQTRVATLPRDTGRIAVEPDGKLVLAAADGVGALPGNGWIARFDPATGVWTSRLEDADAMIGGILVEPDGAWTVSVIDSTGVRISGIDPASQTETPLHGWICGSEVGDLGHQIAIDARLQLVVLSGRYPSSRVVRVDPTTGFQDFVTNTRRLRPVGQTVGRSLQQIRLAPDGRIFFAESLDAGSEIIEVDAAGSQMLRFATSESVSSFVVDRDGSLLVALTAASTSQLHRVDPATGASAPFGSAVPVRFAQLGHDGDGSLVASGAGRVFRFDPASGGWPEIASATVPWGDVFLDGVGSVWFAGTCNRGVASTPTTRLDLATGAAERLPICAGVAAVRPRCANGLDDDRDGAVDWPADASCSEAGDDAERPRGCGLGAELGALVLAIGALRRRTMQRREVSMARRTEREP